MDSPSEPSKQQPVANNEPAKPDTVPTPSTPPAPPPADSKPENPSNANQSTDSSKPPEGEHNQDDPEIVRPASDHFKITPAALPANLKHASLFSSKGVASWYQINSRAAKAALIAGFIALAIGSGLTYLAIRYSKRSTPQAGFNPQSGLDKNALEKLSTDQLNIAKPGQTLTILADSKFKNGLAVGGNTALHAVTIDGTSAMQGGASVQNYLNVAGTLSVTGSLNVGGNGSFGGVLSVNTLTVKNLVSTGGITLGGHILTGGATPNGVSGPAAAGGSVTISGNDTSGTVIITTGSSPFAGQLATINFRTAFASTPHVVLTPVGPTSARLQSFITKSLAFFTIESLSKPDPNTTYTFDYFVAQ